LAFGGKIVNFRKALKSVLSDEPPLAVHDAIPNGWRGPATPVEGGPGRERDAKEGASDKEGDTDRGRPWQGAQPSSGV